MKKILMSLSLILLFSSCKKEENEPTPTTKNYTNFKITSLTVNEIPMLAPSGSGWDILDGPDFCFRIEDANSNPFNDYSAYYENITTNQLPLSWNFTSAFEITNLSTSYFFVFYDYDGIGLFDEVSYVNFKAEDHKSGYPTTITASQNGTKITIKGTWY